MIYFCVRGDPTFGTLAAETHFVLKCYLRQNKQGISCVCVSRDQSGFSQRTHFLGSINPRLDVHNSSFYTERLYLWNTSRFTQWSSGQFRE